MFTCVPIVFFAVMDLEYLKKEFLDKPELYRKGLKENFLSWSSYFSVASESIIHGLLIFLMAYVAFDYSLAKDGATNDLRNVGNLCYVIVVITVTLKVLLDSSNINILVLMASIGSIASYFFFIYTMGLIKELDIFD